MGRRKGYSNRKGMKVFREYMKVCGIDKETAEYREDGKERYR